MDKEATKKIEQRIRNYPNIPQFGGEAKVLADLILIDLAELGYNKPPKNKPPLLSPEEITNIIERCEGDTFRMRQMVRGGAKAQRELDIKWYQGKNHKGV